jgi:hypothetical protein
MLIGAMVVVGLSAVGGVKVLAEFFDASTKVVDAVKKSSGFVGRARTRNAQRTAGQILVGFGAGTSVVYRHSSVHALYNGTERIHPDNLSALDTTAFRAYGIDVHSACNVEDRLTAGIDNNLVLIGSAAAEGLSRIVFGYEPTRDDDSLILSAPPVDLPFKQVLDRSRISEDAEAKRFVLGYGLTRRPNWRIESSSRPYVPQLDNDGWLMTDYLLVTRMRNFLSDRAFDSGQFIVSIGGTHGLGTRAVELLLDDDSLLRQLYVTTKGDPEVSYQALYRIAGIQHNQRKGSRGRKIELVDDGLQLLDDTPSRWDEARRIARHRLGDWE